MSSVTMNTQNNMLLYGMAGQLESIAMVTCLLRLQNENQNSLGIELGNLNLWTEAQYLGE